jgi:hypothetical protein
MGETKPISKKRKEETHLKIIHKGNTYFLVESNFIENDTNKAQLLKALKSLMKSRESAPKGRLETF